MESRKRKIASLVIMNELDSVFYANVFPLHEYSKIQISNQLMQLYIHADAFNSERLKHFRIEIFFEEWIDKYLETDFFNLFRMTPNTMEILTNLIIPLYDNLISKHPGGLPIVPHKKCMLMTVWYLAKGETLISIADRFNVTTSTTHRVIYNIIDCIIKLLPKYISWPTKEEVEYISEEFSKKAKFDGVIGAVDGCHVECKIPLDQHNSYQDRCFDHSITLQGICVSNRLFTDVSVGWPGSIHDARILKETEGYMKYFYDDKYHLVRDSAYPLKSLLMTPYRDNGRLNAIQRKYNTALSMTRVVIENTFGLLKGRWRVLQFVNVYSLERAIKIITACCVLHNFCLINKDDFDDFEPISNNSINYCLGNMSLPENNAGNNKRKEIRLKLK